MTSIRWKKFIVIDENVAVLDKRPGLNATRVQLPRAKTLHDTENKAEVTTGLQKFAYSIAVAT